MNSELTVKEVYRGLHTLTHPTIDISEYAVCFAQSASGQDFFIVSNPSLNIGDTVHIADLEMLQTQSKRHYLLKTRFQQAAAGVTAPVGTKNDGYTPDTFVSPDEMWKAIRGICL